MKPLSFALIFIMVFSILTLVEGQKIQSAKLYQYDKQYYDRCIENALSDGAEVMRMSSDYDGAMNVSPHLAVDTVLESLACSFYGDPNAKDLVLPYVPFVIITDHNGYHVFGSVPLDHLGHTFDQVHYPKALFFHEVNNYEIIYSTEGRHHYRPSQTFQVHAFDNSDFSKSYLPGSIQDWLATENRHQIVMNERSQHLESVCRYLADMHAQAFHVSGDHGTYLDAKGGKWTEAVEHPTLIIAINNLPMANNHTYAYVMTLDLGLTSQSLVYGYVKNGIRYYGRSSCLDFGLYETKAIFTSPSEAAQRGYFPCDACYVNP